MTRNDLTGETILVVDDEEPVRRTFREWLEGAGLDCKIITAHDAEAALIQANQRLVDLAILDWNLGAGNDGLRLLEDLYLFNPDIVAIMVTGFAHQATPLDAMRMGVRDYLDKNQDLDRDTFLRAVRRQLERIRPAKRERHLHASLVAFRDAVEKILPLVQSATALNDPVPLPAAIASLFTFVMHTTAARDGVLLVRSYDQSRNPPEICLVYDCQGKAMSVDPVPFARSVAGTVVSLQEPHAINRMEPGSLGTIDLQPFERGRRSLLAAPLNVAPGIQVVMELFDKQGPKPSRAGEATDLPFTEDDRRLVGAAAELGAEMLRQAMAERSAQRVLFDTVAAALSASDSVAAGLSERRERQSGAEPPPPAVMDRLREGLAASCGGPVDASEAVRLAEAIRVLALRHGPAAVQHCIRLVEDLHKLLDTVGGAVDKQ